MSTRARSVFWDDLEKQLADPESRRLFVIEQNRIQTADRVMNAVIDALEKSGLTRADVARAIGAHSSAVRRLLNQGSGPVNPTLQTLSDVAAVLGYQVELVPMKAQARREVTDQLVRPSNGATSGTAARSGAAITRRHPRRDAPAA
jgi:transcriptional regulator with XRE-family HTH domain